MGIGTILSHGLGSYFSTKNAMDEQEARRQQRQREIDRHEAWRKDQLRAEQDRGERDAVFNDAANLSFSAPQFVQPQGLADAPAEERQQPGTLAEDGGINHGNDVTTYAYGVAPNESMSVESMPESPAAQKSEPGANARVSPHTPLPRQPVEPLQPTSKAQFIASHGVQARAQAEPNGLNYSGLVSAREKLDALRLRAVKIRDPQALAFLNEQGQKLIGQWSAAFPGDPTADPLNYARHLGQVKAVFGEPLTMDEASRIYAAQKAYDAEGVTDALRAAHRGDKVAALKAYDNGQHRFADIELIPANSAVGLPSFNIVGIQADGGKVNLGNAFDAMIAMSGAEAQLKAFVEQRKLANDTRKVDADVIQSKAAAAANHANAAQTNLETDFMRKNGGVKPGAGGAGDKPAELLNKYSGWFKSSLQIGDTMMSDIDPNEAAARQKVYERAMGIAQAAISRGEQPSYEEVMRLARAKPGAPDGGEWAGWSAKVK